MSFPFISNFIHSLTLKPTSHVLRSPSFGCHTTSSRSVVWLPKEGLRRRAEDWGFVTCHDLYQASSKTKHFWRSEINRLFSENLFTLACSMLIVPCHVILFSLWISLLNFNLFYFSGRPRCQGNVQWRTFSLGMSTNEFIVIPLQSPSCSTSTGNLTALWRFQRGLKFPSRFPQFSSQIRR